MFRQMIPYAILLAILASCGNRVPLYSMLLGNTDEEENSRRSDAYVMKRTYLYCSEEAIRLQCTKYGIHRPIAQLLPPRAFINYACHTGYLNCIERGVQ